MRLLRAIGVCLLGAMAGALPLKAETVAQFRNGPEHTGVFAGPGLADINRQLWQYQTGNRMIASPVAAGGTVFVGGMDGQMHAVDLVTGQARWRFAADAPISATAAVAGGRVFFQSDANTVYALNAADGAVIWRKTTGPSVAYHNFPQYPEVANWDFYASSPLYMDGRIFIGSGDGHIYCLDAATGATSWAVKTGSRVRATPASDGAVIYVGGFDGVMYALDAKTGAKKWTFKTKGASNFPVGEIQSSAALAGGLVLFGSRDYTLYALDAATGRVVWTNLHNGSWVVGSPAVAGDRVCVGSSDADFIRCNDLKTGRELWTSVVGSNAFSSPIVAGNALYVGIFTGQVARLSLADGTEHGSFWTDERVYASPWLENNVLLITVNDGTLRALTAAKP